MLTLESNTSQSAPSGTLFQDYVQRYFAVEEVKRWLLARVSKPVTYAEELHTSLSYACMYFPPSHAPPRYPYTLPPPFLDTGDVLLYQRVFGTIAVGSLYNKNEKHALALLRDSMRRTRRLSTRPKSRKFAVDLAAEALEIIEFAWMEDDSLIVACRKLQIPESDTYNMQSQLVLTADLLFYDVLSVHEFPETPLLRMTLNEKPTICVFCGAHGFSTCSCSSSFKRRVPSSYLVKINHPRSAPGAIQQYQAPNYSSAKDLSLYRARPEEGLPTGPMAAHLTTWHSYTDRIFSINQSGSFFVRWYHRMPGSNRLSLWLKPKHPIAYQFVCGTRQQTLQLCSLYIKHMRLCGNAYAADARLFLANMVNVNESGHPRISGADRHEIITETQSEGRRATSSTTAASRADGPFASKRDATIGSNITFSHLTQPWADAAVESRAFASSMTDATDVAGGVAWNGGNITSVAVSSANIVQWQNPGGDLFPHGVSSQFASRDGVHPRHPYRVQNANVADDAALAPPAVDTNRSADRNSDVGAVGHSGYGQTSGTGVHPVQRESEFVAQIHSPAGSGGSIDSESRGSPEDYSDAGPEDNQGSAPIPTRDVQQYMTADEQNTPMCKECGTKFDKRGNLSRHILAVHLKYKPFRCNQCPATFGYKTHMGRHIRTVHRKDKLFRCEYCDKELRTQLHLLRHKQQEHAELVNNPRSESRRAPQAQIVCEACGGKFSTLYALPTCRSLVRALPLLPVRNVTTTV